MWAELERAGLRWLSWRDRLIIYIIMVRAKSKMWGDY